MCRAVGILHVGVIIAVKICVSRSCEPVFL